MGRCLTLFEDGGYKNLQPLTYTRPVYDLKCGISTLREKILRAYGVEKCCLHTRAYLADLVALQNPELSVNTCCEKDCLLINGRVLADADLAAKIPMEGDDTAFVTADGTLVAVRLSADKTKACCQSAPDTIEKDAFADLPTETVDVKLINYPWDLVHENPDQITADFKVLAKPGVIEGKVYEGVTILGKENVYIAAGATVKPGVVLDAEEGPIFIDEGAKIFPNAVIEGPTYIGKKSAIKIGAKIYEGTSIGEVCKVGGEVEESIIHSYSNKQHEGFLGHAYLGMWVNLGADTNNSDLKNDYGNVKVSVNGELMDSGSMFVGSTIGDHTKTGINSMLNTGTVLGVGCNVFGAGLPPKYVPSFAWGGSDGMVEYRLDKCLQVAERVMARRKIELSDVEKAVLTKVFEMTAKEREAL